MVVKVIKQLQMKLTCDLTHRYLWYENHEG